MSEIDKLFSKLSPESLRCPAPVPVKNGLQGITHDGLLAVAGSGQNPPTNAFTSTTISQTQPASAPTNTNRSLALLDSIFASATPHYNGPNGVGPSQTPATTLQILSPQPTPSAVPQVLNQNVISSLLGLAPSPGGSVSSSCTSATAHRYEGDNESEGGSEEIEYPNSDVNSILAEATRNMISSSFQGKRPPIPSFSFPDCSEDIQTTPRIQGDVTPRPALKGMPSSPSNQAKEDLKTGGIKNYHTPANVPQVPSVKIDKTKPAPGATRKLVPFEPDSELWPYPRQPLDDRASDDDGILELDFTETSALSDINAFLSKQKVGANATNGTGTNGKKKKKEKNKEDREQIEKSWDDPVKMGFAVGPNIPNEPPAEPVNPQPTAISGVKGKNKLNGKVGGLPATSTSKDQEKTQAGLDRNLVTESLISTVDKSSLPQQKDLKQMDRNTFVREVLTLFHVSNFTFTIQVV